jgi:hypothetical protein
MRDSLTLIRIFCNSSLLENSALHAVIHRACLLDHMLFFVSGLSHRLLRGELCLYTASGMDSFIVSIYYWIFSITSAKSSDEEANSLHSLLVQ